MTTDDDILEKADKAVDVALEEFNDAMSDFGIGAISREQVHAALDLWLDCSLRYRAA